MISCFRVDLSYPSEKSIFRADFVRSGLTVIKNPNEVFYMEKMLFIEPRLYVISLSRDPRDVVSSVHRGSRDGGYFTGVKKWVEYQQEFDKIKNHPRVFEVKYEDLVSSPDDVQDALLKKLTFLQKIEIFSSYHTHASPSELSLVAMNGLRPITKKSLGGWKNNLERIKQQLIEYPELPDILIKYGYEDDKAWLRFLDKINPLLEGDSSFSSIYTIKIRYRVMRKCFWYLLSKLFYRQPSA